MAALIVAGTSCARTRYAYGFLVFVVLLVVDAVSMVAPIAFRTTAPADAGFAFVLVYWGPSGMPMPHTSNAILELLTGNSIARLGLTSVLAWSAATVAFGRARPLRPETDVACAWDRAGLRFLLVAIFDALIAVVALLVALLLADGSSRSSPASFGSCGWSAATRAVPRCAVDSGETVTVEYDLSDPYEFSSDERATIADVARRAAPDVRRILPEAPASIVLRVTSAPPDKVTPETGDAA
jgi:hypothetical protein